METAFLTKYDAILCKACALKTDDLLNGGVNWLRGLTAIPTSELWAGCQCEECKTAIL